MKAINSLLTLLLIPAFLQAETVGTPTPLRIAPAADAPVAVSLQSGTEIVPLDASELPADSLPLPEGWVAIRHLDSYQGYVNNEDILKDFSVDLGVGVLLEPSMDAPLLTIVEDGDDAQVVNVMGDWSKIAIRKPLLGYVNLAEIGPVESTPVLTAVADEAALAELPPLPPPPMVNPTMNTGLAPILMSGRLERTRRFFGRGPEQDYQLIDKNGRVVAYLEVGSLLTTEPVERFLGSTVNVFGIPHKPAKSKALILRVESLRLPPQGL